MTMPMVARRPTMRRKRKTRVVAAPWLLMFAYNAASLLFAALVLQQQRHTAMGGQFDWDIIPAASTFTSSATGTAGEYIDYFLYNYTGDVSEESGRSIDGQLFLPNCKTEADDSASSSAAAAAAVLQLDTHLRPREEHQLEATVTADLRRADALHQSGYYAAVNASHAAIHYCLRIDYRLNGESVNFHETVETIYIDLESHFHVADPVALEVEDEGDYDIVEQETAEEAVEEAIYQLEDAEHVGEEADYWRDSDDGDGN